MKTILVPTDFSVCAHNALKYAIGLAQEISAEIALLYVYSINIIDPHMPADYIDQMAADKIKAADEALKNEIDKVLRDTEPDKKSIKITPYKDMGFIHDSIIDKSEELKVDYIIMGTTGAGGLKKILGSNTYNLIAKTKYPVIAVPGGAKFTKWKEIVFATDFKQREYQYIQYLLQSTASFNSRILCLHVNPVNENHHEQEVAELQNYFWNELNSGKLRLKFIQNADAAEGIQAFIHNENPDLLVLLTQKRNWLERIFHKSIVKEISSKASVPILALHEL